jgi:spermidine/putrescine transport system permease protein
VRKGLAILASVAILIAAAIFIFLPVAALVQFSFQDGLVPVPPFKGFSLRWYEKALANRRLIDALWNSLGVAVLSSAVATVLGFLAAYAIRRRRSRWNRPVELALMAPITVSYLIIGMGLLMTFTLAGLPKSLWAVGIGHVVINLPLAFAICASQLGEHQVAIERAAEDLGASPWQTLLLVTAPMMAPSLAAAFAISATLSWDEFVIAFLLTNFDITLPVVIWSKLRTGLNPETNAIGTLVFMVSLVLAGLVELAILRRRGSSA